MFSIDFVHLAQHLGDYKYILVVHLIKYAEAYPTKNKIAVTATDRIFNDFVPCFGFPEKLHFDIGGDYATMLWSCKISTRKELLFGSNIPSQANYPVTPTGKWFAQTDKLHGTKYTAKTSLKLANPGGRTM